MKRIGAFLLILGLMAGGLHAASRGSAVATPWSGFIRVPGAVNGGYHATIPDLNKPIRAAFIFDNWIDGALNGPFTPHPNWDALANEYNAIIITTIHEGDSAANAASYAHHIITALVNAQAQFPNTPRPEIKDTGLVMLGFSASVFWLHQADTEPGMISRTLALIDDHSIDVPTSVLDAVPSLFLSAQNNDQWSSLLHDAGNSGVTGTYDNFERTQIATGRGAPLTVIADVGHGHFCCVEQFDHPFIRPWLEAVLNRRLPATPPTTAPMVLPSWQHDVAWKGTYDVVLNTNTAPWGNEQRLINVVSASSATYTDHRAFIWLPDQHTAQIWQSYSSTGIMP